MAIFLTAFVMLFLGAVACGVFFYRRLDANARTAEMRIAAVEIVQDRVVMDAECRAGVSRLATEVGDFNERLVALETAPKVSALEPESEAEPATSWQRQRIRAENGQFTSNIPPVVD
jgi:hypothetical protein